jgi:hypothetical protein
MNAQNKNRLIFWILIFLVIINLSALITFFTFQRHTEKVACDSMQPQCGQAFKIELGLSQDQVQKVELINSDYQATSSPIVNTIRNIRSDILDELSADVPDTIYINEKSNQLCDFQLQLQKANYTQFLELKKVCDPDQAQRLSALYRELYGCKGMGKGEGKILEHSCKQE